MKIVKIEIDGHMQVFFQRNFIIADKQISMFSIDQKNWDSNPQILLSGLARIDFLARSGSADANFKK